MDRHFVTDDGATAPGTLLSGTSGALASLDAQIDAYADAAYAHKVRQTRDNIRNYFAEGSA
jgi:hypothetical protein